VRWDDAWKAETEPTLDEALALAATVVAGDRIVHTIHLGRHCLPRRNGSHPRIKFRFSFDRRLSYKPLRN
jgi:hypothetical protein